MYYPETLSYPKWFYVGRFEECTEMTQEIWDKLTERVCTHTRMAYLSVLCHLTLEPFLFIVRSNNPEL